MWFAPELMHIALLGKLCDQVCINGATDGRTYDILKVQLLDGLDSSTTGWNITSMGNCCRIATLMKDRGELSKDHWEKVKRLVTEFLDNLELFQRLDMRRRCGIDQHLTQEPNKVNLSHSEIRR